MVYLLVGIESITFNSSVNCPHTIMMLILWIATAITTAAYMSPDSHMVLIEYTVKSTPVERVDLMFEYNKIVDCKDAWVFCNR